MSLPDISLGSTVAFEWEKTANSVTGAAGVVHYQYNDKVLNLMAYIPCDLNLNTAFCNFRASYSRESFTICSKEKVVLHILQEQAIGVKLTEQHFS